MLYHQSILLNHDEVELPSGIHHQTITELDVQNIVNCLMKKVQVKKLSVTAHDDIDQLIPVICELMKECGSTKLNLEENSGSDNFIIVLSQFIRQQQVELQELDISYIENITFKQLGTIISNDLTHLSLVNSHLKAEDFIAMRVKNSKLQYLDISYNQLDEESMAVLAILLCKEKPVTLIMKGCNLTPEEISASEYFGDIEVENLDLSYNPDLVPDGMEEVGRFARKHNTKKFDFQLAN